MKIRQLLDEKGEIEGRFWIKEQKSGKRHEVAFNQSLQETLAEYLKEYHYVAKNGENYLFFNPTTRQPI